MLSQYFLMRSGNRLLFEGFTLQLYLSFQYSSNLYCGVLCSFITWLLWHLLLYFRTCDGVTHLRIYGIV